MVLGIDIGGTNVKFGVIDKNYDIIKKYSITTEKNKGDTYFIQTIIDKATEIKNEYNFKSIGIGTPGTVNSENGIVVKATNLPYRNTPVVEMMQQCFKIPVRIENDGACAIVGEICNGLGTSHKNFLMLTLGTGIGGGIVINGAPYFGVAGGAGEFGHMSIDYDGMKCQCGQVGCFELYASVSALIRDTKKAADENPQSILAKMCERGITGKTVFDAKRAGCIIGDNVIKQYIRYLVVGIENLFRAFEPEAVVIGGAISSEEYIIESLKKQIRFPLKIFASPLGNDAGIIGAAALVI